MVKMNVKTSFAGLLLGVLLGYGVIIAANGTMTRGVRIDGPLQAAIMQSHAILADLAQPSASVLESHLLAMQMALAPATARPGLETHFKSEQDVFAAAHDRWQQADIEPDLRGALHRAGQSGEAYFALANAQYLPALRSGNEATIRSSLQELQTLFEQHHAQVVAAAEAARASQARLERVATASVTRALRIESLVDFVVIVAMLGLAGAVFWLVRRRIGGEPDAAIAIAQSIANGRLDHPIPVRAGDTQSLMAHMRRIQAQLLERKLREQRMTAESRRLKLALDSVSSGVMVADNERRIVYMNRAVAELFKRVEADLRKQLPNFRADKLIGACIDDFHKDPSHQARLLATFTQPHRFNLMVGDAPMTIVVNPIFNSRGEREGAVVEWLDRSAELALERETAESARLASENLRIRIALDSVASGVMVADNDRRIIYMNRAVQELFQRAESDIRKQLPNFRADQLLGANIDSFHQKPSHQATLLAALTSTHRGTLSVGGRTMTIVANPIFNAWGERLGSVVEWRDRTAEVAVEQEMSALVEAAAAGDFSRRIPLEGKAGFYRQLAEGINRVVETTQRGLEDVGQVLKALATGDLTQRMADDYQGQLAELRDNANATVARLREIVGHIRRVVDVIHGAARHIAEGNHHLSQRTESQATSLEETASSLEELTATVKQNADNAKEANTLAKGASEVATRGGEIVERVVQTMGAISDSSRKISDIISVIDSIAFQTNLLALNAAVEAARAGEQGRGFAVVAGEVRNLAQRSSAAAKEIKELISTSVSTVQTGYQQTELAGKTMREVVGAVAQVTDIIGSITAASAEQSLGLIQVNDAVNHMDAVTRENAAMVDQAAAAAASLREQADALAEAVAVFKFGSPSMTLALPAPAVEAEHTALPEKPSSGTLATLPARRAPTKDHAGLKASAERPFKRAVGDWKGAEWQDF